MKDELRRFLSENNSERVARADAFLSGTEEPSEDLGEVLLDARLDAAERFDSNRTESLWLVRLSGEQIEDGWIDHDLQEAIVGPLSREVELATAPRARAEARIGLVGVSTGSVILHFRPRSPRRAPDNDQLDYAVSPADAAIRRVSELHDLLERQAPPAEIARLYGSDQDLLRQTRQLVIALDKNDVKLSTRWWSSTSNRSRSQLSSVGQHHGLRVFETSEGERDAQLEGVVSALDISGTVTVASAAGSKSRLVVGPEAVRSPEFALGNRVNVLARRRQGIDSVGVTSGRAVYDFVGHVDSLLSLNIRATGEEP